MNHPTKKLLWVFLIIFIVHDSAVFGCNVHDCVDGVFEKFEEIKTPKDHFLDAFEKFNNDSFLNPSTPDNNEPEINENKINEFALGYFKNLLKGIKQVEQNIIDSGEILSPKLFCIQYDSESDEYACKEAMRAILGDVDADSQIEIARILNMSGIKAFKYYYLNQTKKDLDEVKVVPAEHEEKIKEIIQAYYGHIFNKAKAIAEFAVFKDPLSYCQFKQDGGNDSDDDDDDGTGDGGNDNDGGTGDNDDGNDDGTGDDDDGKDKNRDDDDSDDDSDDSEDSEDSSDSGGYNNITINARNMHLTYRAKNFHSSG